MEVRKVFPPLKKKKNPWKSSPTLHPSHSTSTPNKEKKTVSIQAYFWHHRGKSEIIKQRTAEKQKKTVIILYL